MDDVAISERSWDGTQWTCGARLRAWRDLLPPTANERVGVVFLAEEGEPTGEMIASLRRVVDDEVELRVAVLAAVRRHYDSVRPKYVAFAKRVPAFMGDPTRSMPENPEPSTFVALHTLNGLFVHPVVKDGIAYVGFSFHAAWEPEHGLGVLTCGRRVIEVGGADTAFLEWIAKKDRDATSESRSPEFAGSAAGARAAPADGEDSPRRSLSPRK